MHKKAAPIASLMAGVIANLAMTEFMVAITGMRKPTRLMEYRGHQSKVFVLTDPPKAFCYFCHGVRGTREKANVKRYLRMPHLRVTHKGMVNA